MLGPIMSEVGQVLAEIADGDPEGVFLYVEFGPGWIGPSVFKAEGSAVRNFECNRELYRLLGDAWHTAPEGKRWSVLEYGIKDGKFSVAFRYPEEVDVESAFDASRRRAALLAHYGDKPVIYPPPPEGAVEFKPN